MIRPAVVALALCVVSSAQGMPYARLQQPNNLVVQVRQGCGMGRQLVDGICVSNAKVRAAVRKCSAGKMRMVNGRCEPHARPAVAPAVVPPTTQQPAATRSRERIYSASVRAAAKRAAEARMVADRLACEAWNKRMHGLQGPAQPSPALGDALNAGYRYLEVKCLGCDTHQLPAVLRRPAPSVQAEPSGRAAANQDFCV